MRPPATAREQKLAAFPPIGVELGIAVEDVSGLRKRIKAQARFYLGLVGLFVVYITVCLLLWGKLALWALGIMLALWAARYALLARYDPRAQPRPLVSPGEGRRHSSILVILFSLVVLTGAVNVVSSRAALSDVTDNSGNSFAADTLDPATGLTATGTGPITLDWTATADTYASGHRVLRATTPGGPYSQIAEVTPRTTTTYVDSPASGTYYYVVRAFYLSWESANSNEDSATAGSTSVTFTSVADTYAQQNEGNNTYGTEKLMEVRSWATAKNARAFVQFDVSSIPAGSTVSSATLTLCSTKVPASTRTYDLHRVTASWVETTLTWNNQPGVAATPTDSSTTPATPGCMTWTVTADVQTWVDGTANNGWRASDSAEEGATERLSRFRTREDTEVPAEQPKLDVVYTAP